MTGYASAGASSVDPPAFPRRAVALAIGATAVGPLSFWMLSAFAPVIQAELGFSSFVLGVVLSLYYGTAALVGVPMGIVVQRLQWERSMALVAVVAGVSLVGVGVLGNSLPLLALFIVLGAVANSVTLPAANLALEMNVEPAHRGVAYGVKQAAVPVSTMVVGLSVPVFAGGLLWRNAFMTAGAAAVILFIAVLWHRLRGSRRHDQWAPAQAATLITATSIPPTPTRFRRVPVSLLILAGSAALGTAATIALGGFLVTYTTQAGMSTSGGALLLAVASGIGIISRIVTGILADRRQRRHLVVIAAMMTSGAVGVVLMALADSSRPVLIAGTIVAFALGWSWNGLFHLAVVRYSRLGAALTTGVIQSAMSVGAMLGPLVFGAVAEVSFVHAWLFVAALLAAAAVGVILARVPLKREHAA